MNKLNAIAAVVQKFDGKPFGRRVIAFAFFLLALLAMMPSATRRRFLSLHKEGNLKPAGLYMLWCLDKKYGLGKIRKDITIAGWADDKPGVRYISKLAMRTKPNPNDSSTYHAALQCLRVANRNARMTDLATELNAFFDNIDIDLEDPKKDNLQRYLFLHRGLSTDHPDVRAWVNRKIDRTLKERQMKLERPDESFEKTVAYDSLSELQDIFEEAGKEFFLISGTLLGACRGGDFISNDFTFDLGVIEDHVNYEEVRKLVETSKSFEVVENECTDEKITLNHTSGLKIKFFIHRRDGDFFVLTTDVHAWYYSAFKLRKQSFLGRLFNVPDDTERYLEENYGNWKHPPAFIDFSYNPPNRIYRANVHGLLHLGDSLHNAILNDLRHSAVSSAKYLNEYFGIDFRSYIPNYAGDILPPVQKRLGKYHDDLATTHTALKFAIGADLENSFGSSQPTAHVTLAEDEATRAALIKRNASPYGNEARDYVISKVYSALEKRLGSFQGRKKFFTPDAALKALQQLTALFDGTGHRFFLVSGTLLGAIRDGTFISSDYDLDLGFFDHELSIDDLRKLFIDNPNFAIDERSTTEFKLGLTHSSGLEVEFFLHEIEDDHFVLKTDIHSWYYSKFDLKQSDFLGVTVNIPDDAERYLTENYGNWRTPTAYFDFSFDTPNRVYNDNLLGLFYLTDRLCTGLDKGFQANSMNAAEMLADFYGLDHTACFPKQVRPDILPVMRRKQQNIEMLERSGFVDELMKTRPTTDAIENNFFTPGPVQMTSDVLHAGQVQTPYFRNAAFSNLVLDCEKLLLDLTKAPKGSRMLLLSASGTGGLDAAVSNFCRSDAPTLVLNSHGFGQRLVDIVYTYDFPLIEHDQQHLKGFTSSDRLKVSANSEPLGATLANAHDTIFGSVNDVATFHQKAAGDNAECLHIVDAISSFMCDPIDMTGQNIDVLVLASQKALGLPPGLAILVISPKAVAFLESDKAKPRSYYFDLRNYLKDAARGQTPFTPPVGIVLQLHVKLMDMAQDGIDAIVADKSEMATHFRHALADAKLPFQVLAEPASNAVTALKCTDQRIHAEEMIRAIERDHRLFLTPSGGALKEDTLRISHMGRQTKADLDHLVKVLGHYVDELA
ncbi:MAG: aminotransferase class V-fold PLP-dependent enzyme [Pseudomonadota bacterium]